MQKALGFLFVKIHNVKHLKAAVRVCISSMKPSPYTMALTLPSYIHRPQMHLIWCRLHKENSPWSFIVLIEQKQVKLRRVTALEPSNFYCAFTIINQKDNREKSMSRTGMIRQRNSIFPSRRVLAVLDITLIDTTDLSP